jgi:hypothetical protein
MIKDRSVWPDIGVIVRKLHLLADILLYSAGTEFKGMSKREIRGDLKRIGVFKGSLSDGEGRRVQGQHNNRTPKHHESSFESFVNNFRRQLIKGIHGVPIFKPAMYCDELRRIGVSGSFGKTIPIALALPVSGWSMIN